MVIHEGNKDLQYVSVPQRYSLAPVTAIQGSLLIIRRKSQWVLGDKRCVYNVQPCERWLTFGIRVHPINFAQILSKISLRYRISGEIFHNVNFPLASSKLKQNEKGSPLKLGQKIFSFYFVSHTKCQKKNVVMSRVSIFLYSAFAFKP